MWGVTCVEKRHPNRSPSVQRQAVARRLEEASKLEQLVCEIQGWNRPEAGGMSGQKVWRCEPGPGHRGSVCSIRRLDLPSLRRKVIDQFQTKQCQGSISPIAGSVEERLEEFHLARQPRPQSQETALGLDRRKVKEQGLGGNY